jgi:glycosyltransferase involved in cell wall biosynthesis
LTAQKDFATLLQAVARVQQQCAVRLIILGEGEQHEDLQRLVADLGIAEIVDMPGFVPNPCSYMGHATVVALSSRWEALPTVLIEAMACGTRVVSTDCPSGPSEVLAGGKYGRLVPVGDASAMASALLDAVQGKAALPPLESWKPYLIEKVAKDYLALFAAPA